MRFVFSLAVKAELCVLIVCCHLDYDLASGQANPVQVLNSWDSIMNNSTKIDTGFIVLEHDLFQQTVDIATGYILPDALAYQPPFNIKSVVECLNMPLSNAYIETNDNATNPPAQSGSSLLRPVA